MMDLVGKSKALRGGLVLGLVFMLVQASAGTSALNRTDGDFWRYHITIDLASVDLSSLNVTGVPAGLSGLEVTGSILYEYLGPDNVTVDSALHPVNVMAVTGVLSGSVALIGLDATMIVQGYVFETTDGQGTVKDDLTTWTNLTWGIGSFAYLKRYEARMVNFYAPPLMEGFAPEAIVLGQSWDETTIVRTIGLNATTGAVTSDTNDTVEIHFEVASETEDVSVPAGTFASYKVTASEDGGSKVVYWWSGDAANFVRQETYYGNSTVPSESMVLEDYFSGGRTDILVFVAVGAAVLAVALVMLGLVMLKRRPRRGEPKPPPELLQLPPT